jgi:hypothetical protein
MASVEKDILLPMLDFQLQRSDVTIFQYFTAPCTTCRTFGQL